MTDRDFDPLVQLARESVLGRTALSLAGTWEAAWRSSAAVRAASGQWARMAAWPIEQRVRVVALTLAWAGLGHALSLFWLPKYVTSGLPLAWVGVFIAAALTVAALPRAFALAWNDRFGGNQKKTP